MISRGYAEKGRALHVPIQRQDYGASTLTVTCLTNLTVASGTFLSDAHVGTNSSAEWLAFVIKCVSNNVG